MEFVFAIGQVDVMETLVTCGTAPGVGNTDQTKNYTECTAHLSEGLRNFHRF